MTMAKKTAMTDDAMAAYFESFDFDTAVGRGRDPLRALHWATQFREYIDQQLNDVVQEARASGATWSEIGVALGVSHQAAMKRYKHPA
jgi:hypothetical protein